MRDFTLAMYAQYLKAIKQSIGHISRFDEFMQMVDKPDKFCIIRHDVDRKPQNALNMAKLETSLGIRAVYYFRTKKHTFQSHIIREIADLGHEIGYHYESLSDTNGNMTRAIDDFAVNLEKLRQIAEIQTISMHGRPFKPFDNRDIWRIPKNHVLLKEKFGLLGEVYLDIDYTNIAYINDTGRNWTSGKSNVRDHVHTQISSDFDSGTDLLNYLQRQPHPKMIFQIHPERWTDGNLEWFGQLSKDTAINFVKKILSIYRSF